MTPNQRGSDERTDAHDTIIDALQSRRRFLAGTAAVGATALAGCTGSNDGSDGGSDGGDGGSGGGSGGGQKTNPDVDVLNYALTLEHLEHQFYKQGLEAFSKQQLQGATKGVGAEVNAELVGRLETVRAHEKGHVDAITGVVKDLGGQPVEAAEYNFPLDDPAKFLATASVLENTGVAAYKGAAPAIKSNDILASALGIHSVEARHASFLNAVTGKSPYPNAFDAPKTPEKVTEAANPFFESDIAGSVTMDDLTEAKPTADREKSDDTSDVDVLNYALTLEHLEHQFYKAGLEKFSDQQIRDADVLSQFGSELKQSVPGRLKTVRDHEKAHVDVITKTVNKLEGEPVGAAEYNFPLDNPTKFIQTARVLENVGVAAYAGAAPTVKANAVFVAAAKIHSVEARHAGFLNELNGKSPYPDAVDQAMTKKEVLKAADPFFADDMS